MKIKEMIKQLKAVEKLHGNVDCYLIGGVSGKFEDIKEVYPVHPTGPNGAFDKTKPAYGVWFN